MEVLFHLFSVDNTFFTLFDYPMSYLEFFGTLFNIACVYLIAKHNIWNWPMGILGVVFFAVLFYQIRLYSDLIEQVYFLITGFYGWWLWSRFGKKKEGKELKIVHNSMLSNVIYLGIIIVGTLLLGGFMKNIHIYFSSVFPEAASFPYLDAFTTVMSFVATILIMYKKIECWYIWILVDIIGVWLYFEKGVIFVSLLYLIFLVLATNGLITWLKIHKKEKSYENSTCSRQVCSTPQGASTSDRDSDK